MPSAPPVSICLTAYNRAAVLPKTLDSLLSQSFGNYELIISDDSSSDNTEEICRAYEAKDSRVRYFRNPVNLKMPGNLNAALGRARGEYIAIVHDGDAYHPNLILKWKTALDAVPTAAFVFNEYYCVHHKTGEKIIAGMPFELRVDGKEIALHYFRTFTSCVWGTVMARRQAYKKFGPFNPRYGFISDVDMWLRLARDNDVAYVAEPLITLSPREYNHLFRSLNWQFIFLNLGMYVHHLHSYRERLSKEVRGFRLDYPRRKKMFFLKEMAICLKNRRWDRVFEGLAIWRDADDRMLRLIGKVFGAPKFIPDWYDQLIWETVKTC